MTGLGEGGGPGNDKILEFACLISESDDLEKVEEGPYFVIHQNEKILESMNSWCKHQFLWKKGKAEEGGLAKKVLESSTTEEEADQILYEFLAARCTKGSCVLAGNSVHMDKRFLDKYFPKSMSYLHYRILDVSSFKEMARRFYPKKFAGYVKPPPPHRALDDIKGSIEEFKFYKRNLFVKGDGAAEMQDGRLNEKRSYADI